MKHYIDKDALAEEIEKYISNYKRILNKIDKSSNEWVDSTLMLESKIDVLQHILSFLNTLEVKDADFEKELDRIWFDNKFGDMFDNSAVDFANVREICRRFFELGLKVQKGE